MGRNTGRTTTADAHLTRRPRYWAPEASSPWEPTGQLLRRQRCRAGRPPPNRAGVPFSDRAEDEQTRRAERLAALGALRAVPSNQLDGTRLLTELRELAGFQRAAIELDLSGRQTSVQIIVDLAKEGAS